MLSEADKTAFDENGVICVRGAFAGGWLDLARAGIEQNRANPGQFFRDQTRPGDPARYIFDYWSWNHIRRSHSLSRSHRPRHWPASFWSQTG